MFCTVQLFSEIYRLIDCGKSHSKFNSKMIWSFKMYFHSCLPSYLDHEKSGKSTTSFSQTFIKTLTILSGNMHF